MKLKHFLFKIAGVLSLTGLVILYLLVYLFPAFKSINRYKRQLKDLDLKIADFATMESDFSFPDEKERRYFAWTDRELPGKIPGVRTREDLDAVSAKISNYIEKLAKQDGILNLVMKFAEDQTGAPAKEFSARLKNVKSHAITLNFSGELKNAVNFINHIPWGDYYLSADRVSIWAGESFPGYMVVLRVYYIDWREQPPAAAPGEKNQENLVIDYNSEVLLNPIDPGFTEPFPKKELPGEFGIKIFSGGEAANPLRTVRQ